MATSCFGQLPYFHTNMIQSNLFTSLDPQLPKFACRVRRALDLGSGDHPIFLETDIAQQRFVADLEPVKCNLPTVTCEGALLPFPEESFDLIISRVAIPYMNIPMALCEMHRVLVRGGCLWATLHLPRMAIRRIGRSVTSRDFVDVAYQLYALLNGLLLMAGPFQMRWIDGRFESVQTPQGIRRQLQWAGFTRIQTELCPEEQGRRHFGVLAYKP